MVAGYANKMMDLPLKGARFKQHQAEEKKRKEEECITSETIINKDVRSNKTEETDTEVLGRSDIGRNKDKGRGEQAS
tara:strand:- start:4942 stop:5172 length:231 start_codon:yes stop_codon:yes gene_type:complete